MATRWRWGLVAVAGLLAVLASAVSAQVAVPPADPQQWVQIDGAKDPQMIPEWYTWRTAFRIAAISSPSDLPRELLLVLSHDEAARLIAAGLADSKGVAVCNERLLEIKKPIDEMRAAGAKPKAIVAKMRELDGKMHEKTVECRQDTLDRRDRLLTDFRPEARVALEVWAEGRKKGMSAQVSKGVGLRRFMEPK